MKVSLITACYNSAATIRTAIESVLAQRGVDVEYIIVDGGSTDGTVEIIKGYEKELLNLSTIQPFNFRWLSEKDSGMYDAINKGIKMATGDVIGILNADDVLATDDTLAHIAQAFGERGTGRLCLCGHTVCEGRGDGRGAADCEDCTLLLGEEVASVDVPLCRDGSTSVVLCKAGVF